jgi:O-antigen ligase
MRGAPARQSMTALITQTPTTPGSATDDTTELPAGQLRRLRTGSRSMGWIALLLAPVLAGYALLDKGFAYIRIPGPPIFFGEILVMLTVLAALVATGYLHRGIAHSTMAKLLLVFAAWGIVRTLPYLGGDGINAVRDAALWYYSLLAIAVCSLVQWDTRLARRWAVSYRHFLPWLLLWSPVALIIAKAGDNGLAPIVPGSDISIWNHSPGNIAVHATIALAFLWLVPQAGGRTRPALTALATIVLLIGATQNRGGLVAAMAGLGLAWLFSKRRGRLTALMVAVVVVLLVAGWGLNIQVRGQQGRRISVEQLLQNIGSLTGGGDKTAAGNLDSNVQFRNQLWSAVIKKVTAEKKVMTGLGFGANVAKEVGFQGPDKNSPLRSPHNSHVDVFARMGLIGAAIWILLWGCWFTTAMRGRARLRALGRGLEVGLIEVSMVGVTAILVNAYFDPSIETPQVAIWLWTLVGLTMGLVAVGRRASATRT